MSLIYRRNFLAAGVALAALTLAAAAPAQAADQTIAIGYQTGVDPAKVAQADGLYEQATGWQIDWRKFDSGAEVIAAIASGDLQIGYVGSSPLAAAASSQVPIETIFVAALLGDAEALVVRNDANIATPQDLIGKKVGVPFVSTTHYSLLAALKHWQIDPSAVEILNLRPPELAAAFARGDVDAGYVWDPALGKLKESGTVLVSSAEVAEWGAPTFDAWIARQDFGAEHPEVVSAFVQVTAAAYQRYHDQPDAWTASSPEAAKIARITGSKVEDVPGLLQSNQWPVLADQVSPALLGGGTAQALADTAAFLVEQGKVPAVLEDYSAYVNASFALQARTKLAAK